MIASRPIPAVRLIRFSRFSGALMPEPMNDYLRRLLATDASGAASPEVHRIEGSEQQVDSLSTKSERQPLASLLGSLGTDDQTVAESRRLNDHRRHTLGSKETRVSRKTVRDSEPGDGYRAASPSLTAAEIARLLCSKPRLREAILIAEILRRPVGW